MFNKKSAGVVACLLSGWRYNRLLKYDASKVANHAVDDASKNRDEAGDGDSPSPVANQSRRVAPR